MPALNAFLRFVVVGCLGFVIDSTLTLGLIASGLSPLQARMPAILVAMGFTWQVNRRWTYHAARRPTWREAGRYVAVACAMGLMNYTLYSVLTLAGVQPLFSIVAATALQTGAGFFGYRRFAFGGGKR